MTELGTSYSRFVFSKIFILIGSTGKTWNNRKKEWSIALFSAGGSMPGLQLFENEEVVCWQKYENKTWNRIYCCDTVLDQIRDPLETLNSDWNKGKKLRTSDQSAVGLYCLRGVTGVLALQHCVFMRYLITWPFAAIGLLTFTCTILFICFRTHLLFCYPFTTLSWGCHTFCSPAPCPLPGHHYL